RVGEERADGATEVGGTLRRMDAPLAEQLIRARRRIDARGWVLRTGGNLSAVLGRDPPRRASNRSGRHKGAATQDGIIALDRTGAGIAGEGGPSAETRLHLEIIAHRDAGAVLHTHSVWSTFLSDQLPGGFDITGYEMLKGLSGVRTREHREWMPVLENDQD